MPVLHTKDGAALAYADEGEGPAILLVHGWAAHGGFFSDLRARLARSHRVITPTLRAHVGSEPGSAALSVETLGHDIIALADVLSLQKLSALGWSMGAMALWSAAPRLGARLSALVVEEMSPRIVNDDDWAFGLSGGYASNQVESTLAEIASDWPAYAARLAPRMFAPAARARRPDLVTWTAREMAKADPVAMASFWRSMAAQDFRSDLRTLAMPVLAIRGADDQIYPKGATDYVADIAPQGASIAIPGAGHVPHLETPDQFFDQLTEFLHRIQREILRGGINP